MFSKACEYAIKACIYIAQVSLTGGLTNVKQIAKSIDAPEAFTAKILQQISRSGLLQSIRGKQGGFYFVKEDLDTITLYDIILIVDGEGLFTNCGLGLTQCSEKNPCPMHHRFKVVREELTNLVKSYSLKKLADKTDQGLAWLKN